MTARQWRFDPLDTWFFKESRPFSVAGGNELSSVFPPPAGTVAGAVRAAMVEAAGLPWSDFRAGKGQSPRWPDLEIIESIGDSQGLGRLRLRGPYPLRDGRRLYPVPLHLLHKEGQFVRLRPGRAVHCDLDDDHPVALPALEEPLPGAKPLADTWLTGEELTRVLEGDFPQATVTSHDLYREEPRLGIARQIHKATAEEGMLYQTRHLRLHPGVTVGMEVAGVDQRLLEAGGLVRFGGEGRGAGVEVGPCPAPIKPNLSRTEHLLLVVLTPADLGGDWKPPGFEPQLQDGVRVWRGHLGRERERVELILHCALLGKPLRQGGWDLAAGQPRPVKPLIPAGSVWFCTLVDPHCPHVASLQGQTIIPDDPLGRGELAVGRWTP